MSEHFSQPIDNTWKGITCDEANGRVVKMEFSNDLKAKNKSFLEGLFAMLLDLGEGNMLLRGRGCCLIFAELEEGRQQDACVRPSRKPPNSSFCPPCPVSPAGDLSEIQWPAALQTLNISLHPCCPFGSPMKITGKLQPRFAVCAPNEHSLVRPQPQTS